MEYTYIHNHQSQFIEWFGSPELNDHGLPIRKLGNLGTLDRGVSKVRPRNRADLYEGDYPFIQTGDITKADRYIFSHSQTYSETGLKQSKLWPSGTLCITIAANIAETAILTYDCCFPDSVVGFIPSEKINLTYIQYWFKSLQQILERQAPQTAQKNINLQILSQLDVMLPPKFEQERFSILVDQADKSKFDGFKSQFIEWFGGDKFVSTTLPEISENLDYKRVPITSGDRNVGQFPYYGASGIVDYIDNYIFDEPLLLVSEDGANLKDRVTPIAFIAEGKYWVNNHAHVLKFTNFANMAYICHFFNFTNIEKYLTGMAQPKLNQAQLNTIKIPWPPVKMQEQFAALVEQADKSKYYEINETIYGIL